MSENLCLACVSIDMFHLFRYVDEQSFRFNGRKGKDCDRFLNVANSVSGRRLQYKQLIGESVERKSSAKQEA